jgi:two-component system sensor histidine kinase PilS (NtrC family)
LRRAGALEERLVVLMAARLVLAFVSLGIAAALDTALGEVEEPRRGLYGTVALAFLATVVTGVLLPRIRRPVRFASLNIVTDIAIVTLLVKFSGGADSPFAFLYVVVALYSALLFERKGALITAGLGGIAHGAILLAGASGAAPIGTVVFTAWALNAGAVGGVALLGSFLASELRRTGEALRQRTDDLRQLADLHQRTVESLMSGLLTTDTAGRITSFNPEAERITGLPSGEVLGRDVEEVLPGIGEVMETGLCGGKGSTRTRITYTNAPGRELYLGLGAYILRDESRGPRGRVVIFQDVTEVVAMEEELRRSERLAAIGELSASIAHEIRNPLAAISGSIQLLQREAGRLEGAEASTRLMQIVVRETDRLNALITDFLEFARPAPLKIEPVELSGLVEEMLVMFQAALPEGVRVRVDVPNGLAVWGDASHLRQALWNLALNGVQAMPEGGVLRVSAAPVESPAPQEPWDGNRNEERDEGWVEVTVQDQGTGISEESLERVFDPFFTTKPEGSGLGLSTVHRSVEEHGGSLRLESSEEEGTVVRLRLPRAGEPL